MLAIDAYRHLGAYQRIIEIGVGEFEGEKVVGNCRFVFDFRKKWAQILSLLSLECPRLCRLFRPKKSTGPAGLGRWPTRGTRWRGVAPMAGLPKAPVENFGLDRSRPLFFFDETPELSRERKEGEKKVWTNLRATKAAASPPSPSLLDFQRLPLNDNALSTTTLYRQTTIQRLKIND